jgi:hypothetical protein
VSRVLVVLAIRTVGLAGLGVKTERVEVVVDGLTAVVVVVGVDVVVDEIGGTELVVVEVAVV